MNPTLTEISEPSKTAHDLVTKDTCITKSKAITVSSKKKIY